MKKIIIMLLSVLLIVSMAVPAYAVTPGYQAPDIPDFSEIKFDIKFEFPEGFWEKWFDEHPISWKPVIKAETNDDRAEVLTRWMP